MHIYEFEFRMELELGLNVLQNILIVLVLRRIFLESQCAILGISINQQWLGGISFLNGFLNCLQYQVLLLMYREGAVFTRSSALRGV